MLACKQASKEYCYLIPLARTRIGLNYQLNSLHICILIDITLTFNGYVFTSVQIC